MSEHETTRPSLLIRIRDADDRDAWTSFIEIYGPLVYQFARKKGLQDADASDVVQDVLRQVSGSIKGFDYDPNVGKFRSWLLTIARYSLSHLRRQRKRQPVGSGDTQVRVQLENIPEEDRDLWDDGYKQRLFQWAADQVRDLFQDKTWNAFWRTAVKGESGQAVADQLEISVGSVYVAKSRVMKRISAKIAEVEDWEVDGVESVEK